MSSSGERFLVTGAGGCIGAWVVALLARDGTPVVGLDLDTSARRLREVAGDEVADRVTIEEADITSKDDVARVVDAHDITNLVHLAALQVPFCRADPILGANVNVTGTINVFEVVRERLERMKGVTYASSAALFGPDDGEIAARDESGIGTRPATLYGVYKQANEGSARIYWLENEIPSIGLRPYTVYGPGRDQGVTSAPTMAIAAAVRGERYTIPFGGAGTYNYAPDVASAFIGASRAVATDALVFNMPGPYLEMEDVVATIDRASPGAGGLIDYDADVTLPIPARMASDGLGALLGSLETTPFDEGVEATVDHFAQAGG